MKKVNEIVLPTIESGGAKLENNTIRVYVDPEWWYLNPNENTQHAINIGAVKFIGGFESTNVSYDLGALGHIYGSASANINAGIFLTTVDIHT